MKIRRLFLCILLLLTAVFGPNYLVPLAQRDFFAEQYRRDPPKFSGTIVLYHIVTQRTYSGSVTDWLQAQADAYEKKHRGVHILVEGMTEPYFLQRLEYDRLPDGYSFFSGALSEDRLQPIGLTTDGLRSGLFDTAFAVPYLYSGYALLTAGQPKIPIPQTEPIAQLTSEARTEDCVAVALRTLGDRLRDEQYGAAYVTKPIGTFTDAVCWLGIAHDTPEEKAEALRGFYAYLREEKQQQKLFALNAFSVLDSVRDSVAQPLETIAQVYRSVCTPDPFLWEEQHTALLADATEAMNGSEEARRRFAERLAGILGN